MKTEPMNISELKAHENFVIGKMPKAWKVKKGKYLFDITTGNLDVNAEVINGEYPFFTCSMFPKRINSFAFDTEALLVAGNGLVGYTQYYNGKFNAYQRTYVLNNFKAINPLYLKYYVTIMLPLTVEPKSVGSVISFIKLGDLSNFEICVPNSEEQELIANYLDDRCSKIDAIIAEAKASIEEYKELKQAVITQAVTLGIKKNRPLKDTNILWIGKTPCDWQVAELKFFASIKSGITLGQKYPAGAKLVEMPYLRVANVQGEYVDLSDVKTIQVLPEEVDKYRLEAGVVLMTEGGDRDKLGRGCVWHGEITPCLHQNHIFALTTKSDKLLPEYFSHVTTSEVARCYFDYTAKKTTNLANTNSSTIMNFRLPIPPLEEQREIVQYLDKRIKTLNDMIFEKQSLIEDLEAYKKSLIYEVVTGKRKVVA